jgi:hypothetical protein
VVFRDVNDERGGNLLRYEVETIMRKPESNLTVYIYVHEVGNSTRKGAWISLIGIGR